ncbi:MAG: general secretion pathway protein GspK, partial [Candidatus Omnitrophica bacterium]|nr:general secretion pathway protein GspK [Candidatus Omnitrophota bacterium]
LMMNVLGVSDNDAKQLADNIIDWRDIGRHEVTGFFSDDYYKNLEFPYEMKDAPYERPDELLLIKGMSAAMYEKIAPYITVAGDGRVNVNTASFNILVALGLDAAVAEKVLQARRGPDGIEATKDDHIFYKTFDIASEVGAVVKLDEKESRQIDALNKMGLLGADSFEYSFRSQVRASGSSGETKTIFCMINALNNKIDYWYEK